MSIDISNLYGFVEVMIDLHLEDTRLSKTHKFFEMLKPTVSNRVDAIFGFIVGWIFADISSFFSVFLKRQATQEEMEVIANAITKRFLEIKNKIYEND